MAAMAVAGCTENAGPSTDTSPAALATYSPAEIEAGIPIDPTGSDSGLVESAQYFFMSTEEGQQLDGSPEMAAFDTGIVLSPAPIRDFDVVFIFAPAPGCFVAPSLVIDGNAILVTDPIEAEMEMDCEAIFNIGAIGINWTKPVEVSDLEMSYLTDG